MTTDEALLTADGHGGDATQALAVLAAEVRRNAATIAVMREAIAALDWCLEDSDELISRRAGEWGLYRADRQAAMAAKAAEHHAVAERLRAALSPEPRRSDG